MSLHNCKNEKMFALVFGMAVVFLSCSACFPAQKSGTWQQLPRIPRLRSTADSSGSTTIPDMQLHARHVIMTNLRYLVVDVQAHLPEPKTSQASSRPWTLLALS